MSGRKKSEVLDLLSTGSQIRSNVLKNTFKNIEELFRKNQELLKKLKKIKSELEIALPTLPTEAKEKYKEELKNLIKLIEKIKTWDYEKNIDFLDLEKNSIEDIKKIFTEIDREADRLRKIVANKSHYCNSEYAQASTLVTKSKNNQNKILDLELRIADKVRINSTILEKGENLKSLKVDIENQYTNIKARALADNNKEQIQKEFSSIVPEWGIKFLKTEYSSLEKEIETLIKKGSTLDINTQANNIFDKISLLRNKVLEKKSEYDLKKQQCLREFKEINEKLNGISFEDIEEKMMNESEEEIGLFEFEKKYSKISSEKEWKNLLQKIQSEITSENFDESLKNLETAREFIDNSIIKATKQYEKLLKEQDIVSKIVGAANELGYDISVNYIEEDIRNGYIVEAIAGDEIINFDRISVSEDGETIIELDHQESVKGTCGNSMKNFMKAMQNEGIFITDITHEGRSVIYKDREAKVTTKNENKVMTKN